MREYAKVAPTFWTGTTGKEIRRRGSEGVVVALYLMSSPHSNMLGLYYQPMLYLAHETGLGIEGASKGLRICIECGFCEFDDGTEMVWVPEMAAYQIGNSLSSGDKRCKGIQKDFESLPNNPFLQAFFDRYGRAFHLTRGHPEMARKRRHDEGASKGLAKPHRSQEQEQEQEQGTSVPDGTAAAAAPPANDLLDPDPPKVDPPVAPMAAKERLWGLGVALLGDKGRAWLGKAVATYGEATVLDALSACNAEQPGGDAKGWLTRALEARAKAAAPPPRVSSPRAVTADDLLNRDPRPPWVLQAGFDSIWQAENEGCYAHNAALFRRGQRIANEAH